jgi:hypothetical protein
LAKSERPQSIDALMSKLPQAEILAPSSKKERQEIFNDLVQHQILKVESRSRYWFIVLLFVNWILSSVDDEEIVKLATEPEIVPLVDVAVDKDLKLPDRVELFEILERHFDREELHTLCFYLGVDYDSLPSRGKTGKARELIRLMSRQGRLNELLDVLKNLRPDIQFWTEGIKK